jgi:excisionase family DNA binding protein
MPPSAATPVEREEPLLLTVVQAAQRISIGRSKLHELITDGQVQSVKIGGSRRIPVESLDRFISRLLEAVEGRP